MKKKVCILSIDGGGIRGVLPGMIVKGIEKELQLQTGNDDVRISDFVDLFAGTSTGGILSCLYLAPGKNKRPKFTAQEAVELYLNYGDEIFSQSIWQKVRSAGGVRDEKYDATELEDQLEYYFGETQLRSLLKPCVITAYNIRDRYAHFFRQHRALKNKDHDFLVRDVARSTAAAPTYFECARVKSNAGKYYPLIDGGVFANNPTLCAYAEARTMNFNKSDGTRIKHPGAKDMFVVSLSTGSTKQKYLYSDAKDYGMVQWIRPLIDIMMSGNSETVNYQLEQIWDTLLEEDKYDFVRLHPDRGDASEDMDNGSKENLNRLAQAGESFCASQQERIKMIAERLIAYQ